MVTLGSSLARLAVRFRPPHPCLLFLVLVILLVLPVAAAEEVYQVGEDAADPVPVYQQTAAEVLANVGIMPLAAADWSTTDSQNLQRIADRLISGSSSAASLLSTISAKIGTNPNTIFYFLNTMDNRLSNLHNAVVGTGYVGGVSMGEGLFGHLRNMTNNYLSPISSSASSILTAVRSIDSKSLPVAKAGWYYLDLYGNQNTLSEDWDFVQILESGFLGLASRFSSVISGQFVTLAGYWILDSDGSFHAAPRSYSFMDVFSRAMGGLSLNLSGGDKSTVFSFLPEDIFADAQQVTSDNLLDALGIMGTQLQQPLQRLAYVFANPQDLEIRQDVSDNLDQAQEDFFKPDGQGAVSPGNIKDAAGISGGAAGALASPGSVGDVTGQINNPDNFSFFSQTTLVNLDTVPVTVSEDEDDGFVDFYDPSNSALWEALGK